MLVRIPRPPSQFHYQPGAGLIIDSRKCKQKACLSETRIATVAITKKSEHRKGDEDEEALNDETFQLLVEKRKLVRASQE